MVKEIGKEERDGYITGALNLSREKIEGAIDAYRRGNYGQVLSSLYYAYFHLIKALLYQKGFDPKSHEGVYSMLNLHFIKPGTLDKKYSRLFEHLHKAREIADYNPLAPKYDKGDAAGYVHTFSEVAPGIIEIIRNYDEFSKPVSISIEELKRLSKQ
ncbi:MAG: HEPN domain-containing protein [Nitrospirae bacterium]|nr:HEPN domain-containing protein [Nitrospirota bacterium]